MRKKTAKVSNHGDRKLKGAAEVSFIRKLK